MPEDQKPFSINFDPEKENGATVFIITQFMDAYDATGEGVKRIITPNMQVLYLGVQALYDIGEITQEKTTELLTVLRVMDDGVKAVGRVLGDVLTEIKAKHHVENIVQEATDGDAWDNLTIQ